VLRKIDSEASALLRGRFDETVLLALRCHEKSSSHQRALALATKSHLERLIEILTCSSPSATKLKSATALLTELVRLIPGNDNYEATVLEDALSSLLAILEVGMFEKLDNAQQEQVCRLAALLCLRDSSFESPSDRALAVITFARLLSRLPTELQASPSSSILTIELITRIFETFHLLAGDFDLNSAIVPSLLTSLSHVLLRCDNCNDGSNIPFMKLLHLLLMQTSSNNSPQDIPKAVLSMIINHPNFPPIITLALDHGSESLKFQVLCLMLCCISASSETTYLDDRVIDTLLKGFNASTSRCDTLIRRVLHAYCSQQPEVRNYILNLRPS
jgi:hypothetical protein